MSVQVSLGGGPKMTIELYLGFIYLAAKGYFGPMLRSEPKSYGRIWSSLRGPVCLELWMGRLYLIANRPMMAGPRVGSPA